MAPEMQALLEVMGDRPGAVSNEAAAGAAWAALREIERLRAALREIVEHTRNDGAGNSIVDERIIERCEETAMIALTANNPATGPIEVLRENFVALSRAMAEEKDEAGRLRAEITDCHAALDVAATEGGINLWRFWARKCAALTANNPATEETDDG